MDEQSSNDTDRKNSESSSDERPSPAEESAAERIAKLAFQQPTGTTRKPESQKRRNPNARQIAIRKVENILYETVQDVTASMVAFALDETKDDRARATLLPKIVEMVRPPKSSPLVVVENRSQIISHLSIPIREVGPGRPGDVIDVPPLLLAESEKPKLSPVRGDELESATRMPTAKQAETVPARAAQAQVLDSESEIEERLGEELRAREQGGASKRVLW